MCKELCDKFGPQGCPDCGRLICFDAKNGDDILRPAYITNSGELFCARCGTEYDCEDELVEEDYYWNDELELD